MYLSSFYQFSSSNIFDKLKQILVPKNNKLYLFNNSNYTEIIYFLFIFVKCDYILETEGRDDSF